MARTLEYIVVDAFTDQAYGGNPAAVVLDAAGLTDQEMAAIAREFNLSETTFVLPADVPDAAIRFRWFTPGAEVRMCGHATLAGVHALTESGRFAALRSDPEAILPIQTASGVLATRMEPIPGRSDAWLIWLEMPRPVLKPRSLNLDKLTRLLGITTDALDKALPVMETQDTDVIVFVRDHQTLHAIVPSYAELAGYQQRQLIRGFCLATARTLAPSIQVQSRFFCPMLGVNEDPVTGSVHGPLATYLVINGLVPTQDRLAAVSCVQSAASGRAGLVRAMVTRKPGEGYEARIAGQCVATMRGRLTI